MEGSVPPVTQDAGLRRRRGILRNDFSDIRHVTLETFSTPCPSPIPSTVRVSAMFLFAHLASASNGTTKMTPTDLYLIVHRVCPVLLLLLLCSKSCCALSLEHSRTHLGGARRAARPSPSILHQEFRFRSDHHVLRRRHDWRLELAPNIQQEGHVTRARQHHEKICGNSCTQQRPVSSPQRHCASALRASTPSSVDDDASTTTTTGNDEGDLQSNALADPTNDDGDNSLSISKVQAVLEDDDDDNYIVPSVSQILRFAIPAIGVWLCSPLLSMIDTSVVGLFSGTIQQAALNPAVAGTCRNGRREIHRDMDSCSCGSPVSCFLY
jgi:hypothetical protein